MEWSKLKNIILLMLVAVNVFLLILVVYRQRQTVQLEAMAREDVVEVLRKNGIAMDPNGLPRNETFWNLKIQWDPLQARRVAEAALGYVTEETLSSIIKYKSEKGTANFQGNGPFSIVFNTGESMPSEQEKTQRRDTLLHQMKLETEDVWSRVEDGETVVYSARQQVDGVILFNCVVTVTYVNHCLASIEGTCLMGTVDRSAGQQMPLSAFTALVKLIQYESGHGAQSSEIQSIQTGCLLPAALTDVVQLEPVWCIVTDRRMYYVHEETGVVIEAEKKKQVSNS